MVGSARALQGCRGGKVGRSAAGFKMAFQSVKAMARQRTKDRYGTSEIFLKGFEFINSVKK